MFKLIKGWIFWWKRSKKAKAEIKRQIELYQKLGPAEPPTVEEVEAFKKEWDLGWDSHMVQKIESKKRYFEASLN